MQGSTMMPAGNGLSEMAGTKMGVNILDETIYEKTMGIEARIRLCQRKIVKNGPKGPKGPKD